MLKRILWISIVMMFLAAVAAVADSRIADCYTPVKGGWHIRITADKSAERPKPCSRIGAVSSELVKDGVVVSSLGSHYGDSRQHCRPLYPPADKSLILTAEERAKTERYSFRPLIRAYNVPRFVFDYHTAGGLMGHLYLGIALKSGPSKWFHEWSELDVSYVDGRMDYRVSDPSFPGVVVFLSVSPLAGAPGLIVNVNVSGLKEDASLVWMHGGANAFYTCYHMQAPEFNFNPNDCSADVIAWKDGAYTLTRGFEKSVLVDVRYGGDSDIRSQDISVPKNIPGWKAVLRGGSSWRGRVGLGDPAAVLKTPAELVKATDWVSGQAPEKLACVAVQEVPITGSKASGYVLIGMGGNMRQAIENPEQAWKDAMRRNESIARRVVIDTPDTYLDEAMTMIAFQTEGSWGDTAYLSGAWSWRNAYLGWRVAYGPVCYGYIENARRSIANHCRMGLITDGPDKGALGIGLDWTNGIYYNMDEVFVDMVRHYFDYTNDLDLMREIFPVIEGIAEWESRRLQPENEYLYENSLNTWISDQHWYTRGQCTQSSAYNYRINSFLADVAGRLGKDPTPFRQRAERIRAAMQRKLWMPRQGVFAEFLDTRGNRMLHTEPELPTIYHSAEFDTADPLQVYQMLHWADTHLKSETTPGGGKQYWSSNWFPNNARSYTHSTYEMAYAEELNFALTNCLAGRADEAYPLIRASICGIYNGPTPGGLACHAFIDGRLRTSDDFADAGSMWGRAIVEGMFGIVPKAPRGYVELTPQFLNDWPRASIKTRQFCYSWKKNADTQSIEWSCPTKTSVHLRLAVRAARIEAVKLNGANATYRAEPGVDLVWVCVDTPNATRGTIEVTYSPSNIETPAQAVVKQGDNFNVKIAGAAAFTDPQGILSNARIKDGKLIGTVSATPGPALLFVSTGSSDCRMWIPVSLVIEPKIPVPPAKMWSAPKLPGKDLNYWSLIDISTAYNAPVPEVVERVKTAVKPPPLPALEINTIYYKDHISPVSPALSDETWRKKVGDDGVGWTTDGIPFKSTKVGSNIAAVTLEGGFPESVEFPVNASGKTLYLMISGQTFPMQSHVVNVRTTLNYADGTSQPVDMVNPFDIGNCWGYWVRYHDNAKNGFENIGGRLGPAGSSAAGDLTKPIKVDHIAHLVAFDMKQGVSLKSVKFEAVANDVIFGVMGATVLK